MKGTSPLIFAMAKNKRGAPAFRGAKNATGGRGDRGAFRGGGSYSSTPPRVNFLDSHLLTKLARRRNMTILHGAISSLRLRPVTFVSAGPSEPLKLLDAIVDPADEELEAMTEEEEVHEKEEEVKDDQFDEQSFEESTDKVDFIGPDDLEEAIQAETIPEESTPQEVPFFFDLTGDQLQKKKDLPPVEIPDRPSSRSSTSSEEVLLFKGRGAQRNVQPVPDIDMVQMQTEIRVVEQAIIAEPAHSAQSPAPELQTEPIRSKNLSKKEKKQKKREKRNAKTKFDDEEDAILADYIANLKENTEVDDYFKELLEGGRHSDDSGVSESANAAGDDTDADTDDAEATNGDEVPSEIDDETLARLIAGQQLGQDLGMEDPASARRQGARAQISFNLSDSELEASLQASWKSDRLKKSERKKQREEMRALGMLGKKDPDDLRVKYPDGMNMDQVADELQTFLMGSDEQLNFPPMDNNARKMIHELASKFKLKSKSIGKGDQRRPTLHRTKRTPPYVPATFDQALKRVNRKYLPRSDKKGKKGNRLPPARGGTSVAAATYQDGEVVGASAPELGIENRGRAMLEKMGWSMGTALGASNNKGIMQPVTHTMKRSKAGLG
ncbi:hypothetical protein FOXG_08171 [Fusarium oxysporum f. sp. lycopersici 4287]|uniref:Protein SQS1 n=1 Tax=Fusarium oxysporum f. sp. lycopersici (strain 4287 / CBS 123668 / FGSC 9935 / NRRL 34936) TaxID=426428 RepID=A0A0J9V5K1_FUSO4|nr:hypothetical protein FOXG_08171 [Fusarium oxysporum f. sp. lycopersici 4287]KNB06121.1 hypothetical protein FOXG_08171 [Fusarium oxysporum f. sp. lycopersici 4287]